MLLNRETAGGRWRRRPDGRGKVTGELRYLTDLEAPGMLHGKVLRSKHPHAFILDIRTEKALAAPGVAAVITHRDVPGLNRFGIVTPDQPVLCEERVRYVGDAIAAVAATTKEEAAYALSLIEVDYEPIPVVDDPEAALLPEAPKLHPDGNVLHRTFYRKGNPEEAFALCAHVVEETYYTPRQMHAYMETEGGLFMPDSDGRLTVYAATQHGFKDRMQLSRILAMPEPDIRIISSPIGGSFGGKDELNVQPYGALLALKTGRPVKLHNSRRESVRAGLKRHPMKLTMKTGMDAGGKLVAHQAYIVADTGAYSTLGAPVLNFATEHAMGPYRIPHIAVEGVSVFTNNGVSGEFRGFGGNQAIFAVESQMERLAEAAGIDPWVLRGINLREPDDPGPLGQRILPSDGVSRVWQSVADSELWRRREAGPRQRSADAKIPWIRRGIGAALAMHGSGLGYGIPDPGGGRLGLNAEGKLEAAFSFEEFGQGITATLEMMLTDMLGCAREDLRIVIGDTDLTPHNGSSTASRSTTIAYMALRNLVPRLTERMFAIAAAATGYPADALKTGPGGIWLKGGAVPQAEAAPNAPPGESGEQAVPQLQPFSAEGDAAPLVWPEENGEEASPPAIRSEAARALQSEVRGEIARTSPSAAVSPRGPLIGYAELAARAEEKLSFEADFHFPVTPDPIVGGHYLYTGAAVAVEAEVNLLTGAVRVLDQYHAIAAGPAVNPMGYVGQIEGGSVMAQGFTLSEDAVMADGRYRTENLDTYLIPTIADIGGGFQIDAIEELPPDDPFGPRGIGEVGSVALAPAIAAAVHQAIGRRIAKLPIRREEIMSSFADMLNEGVKSS